MIKKKIISLGILAALVLMVTPINLNFITSNISIIETQVVSEVLASVPAPPTPERPGIGPERLLTDIIILFRNILFLLGALMIIYGAFTFVTAQGDDKKIETGRKVILYALIAVAVAALAHALVDWVRHWVPR